MIGAAPEPNFLTLVKMQHVARPTGTATEPAVPRAIPAWQEPVAPKRWHAMTDAARKERFASTDSAVQSIAPVETRAVLKTTPAKTESA